MGGVIPAVVVAAVATTAFGVPIRQGSNLLFISFCCCCEKPLLWMFSFVSLSFFSLSCNGWNNKADDETVDRIDMEDDDDSPTNDDDGIGCANVRRFLLSRVGVGNDNDCGKRTWSSSNENKKSDNDDGTNNNKIADRGNCFFDLSMMTMTVIARLSNSFGRNRIFVSILFL